jgi:hypothetical protein
MEVLQNGLFWEVNERVVAFDWVEDPLRAEIPRLRSALKRAKATGRGPAFELEDQAEPKSLVSPTVELPAVKSPAPATNGSSTGEHPAEKVTATGG